MNLEILYQWRDEIARQLPSLNSWQLENVALFSQGIIHAESSQEERIARQVVCGEKVSSAARRLRRFLDNDTLNRTHFFSEWSAWVSGALGQEDLFLCVDETKISPTLAAMVVGVAFEARCIPLAWRCYDPHQYPVEGQVKVIEQLLQAIHAPHQYPVEGQVKVIEQLLQAIHAGLPASCGVCVLADRGIGTSPDLCRAVNQLGWTYLFRVTCQSKIVTAEAEYTIYQQVVQGQVWSASGLIFKKRGQIPAHALALWSNGYDEPWALVTNDEQLTGYEYAHRNWQEQSFRDLKSCGWQWDSSHIRRCDHMANLMILLVLAYAWILGLGSLAVALDLAQPLQRHRDGQVRRHWGLFKEGLQFFTDWIVKIGVCLKLMFIPDKRFT